MSKNQPTSTKQFSSFFKTAVFLSTICGLTLLALAILPVSQASPGNLPQLEASPRPPLENGDNGRDSSSSSPSSAIYGKVTDLSRQQPGAAVEVSVNGAIVRTDTEGKYSITGLSAGDYTVSLALDGQGMPAQGPIHVGLGSSHNAVINLDYYSQPIPTDTPQPTATVSVVTAASTPAAIPDAGAPNKHQPLSFIWGGLILLTTGVILFHKNRSKQKL